MIVLNALICDRKEDLKKKMFCDCSVSVCVFYSGLLDGGYFNVDREYELH